MDVTIDIGNDFTKYPGGRYAQKGPFSGEEFRDEILVPALKRAKDAKVNLLLDNAIGYSSSFLEESFGGLIRLGYTVTQLKEHLSLISSKPVLIDEIWEYILGAAKDTSIPVD